MVSIDHTAFPYTKSGLFVALPNLSSFVVNCHHPRQLSKTSIELSSQNNHPQRTPNDSQTIYFTTTPTKHTRQFLGGQFRTQPPPELQKIQTTKNRKRFHSRRRHRKQKYVPADCLKTNPTVGVYGSLLILVSRCLFFVFSAQLATYFLITGFLGTFLEDCHLWAYILSS